MEPKAVPAFQLDSRLAADTVLVAELDLCSLRLMNDTRWPWLVLVPRMASAVELHDLSEADQVRLFHETVLAGRVLKSVTACEKINSAAIGNIVRQLHVHVVARYPGDPNWPGPVWGQGPRILYETAVIEALSQTIRRQIGASS
jgi:diadenosine tetraphosphate (Ap4A) HIT family hydrolase